jgi:uncharacterized protein YfaS (alpha-2-macroglobulin family)
MGKRSRVRAIKDSALNTILLFFLSLCSPLAGVSAAQPPDSHVLQFTPQGTVKKVRQVTSRFSEPMVPLGDPRLADPFDITCPEPGTARWVDSSTWAYDFARDLPAGVQCTFRLVHGLMTLAGKPLIGQQVFTFSTGGPAITASTPPEGNEGIEEEQAFLLVLDAAPTEASLLQHVSFSVEGITERIGIRLVTGKAREEILAARYRSRPVPDHVVILQAVRRFPNRAKVDLIWGKGIMSQTGVPTGQDQTLHFKARGPFTATFSCERENRQAGCIPVTPMSVEFSASVAREQARKIALVGPAGRRWPPEEDKEKPEFVRGVVFPGPFPEASSFQIELPPGMKDDAGRPLANASRFPLSVKTDPFPPLAKFSARFGIVEWKADPALPVTLRNLEPQVQARLLRVEKEPGTGFAGKLQDLLEQVKGKLWRIPPQQSKDILPWLRKMANATRETSIFGPGEVRPSAKEFMLPKPNGAKAFEVVGIPLAAPGLYIVELESARLGASLLGKPQPMYVPAAALVTNLGVHFKWGREASVAWVTTLDSGRPVPQATVTVRDCQGTVLWEGETDPQGIARIGTLPAGDALATCREPSRNYEDYSQSQALSSLDGGLLIMAQTPDDMSFVHSGWDRGIESWRFRLPEESYVGPVVAHTIFDRSLLRAGETVHMKHLLRLQTMRGFAPVPAEQRPATLSIQHLGSDQKYELPLQWDGSGIAENTWQIPKEAKLGTYEAVMLGEQGKGRFKKQWASGRFRVEEFRVPLMKGIVRLPADPQVAVSEFPADLIVQYLAGGGARELPVTLRAQIRPKAMPAFEEFEDFTFANGPVKEGILRRQANWWEEEAEGEEESAPPPREGKPAIHQREELVLDATGSARTTIARLPRLSTPQDVLVEMEFRDPNGESRTVSSTTPLWPAHRLIGIRPDSWVASKDNLKAWVGVVDVSGRPAEGAQVHVDILERRFYTHRKRLVGGFYAYENMQETRRIGELCRGRTDAKGKLPCEGKTPVDGNLILQASLVDQAGNRTAAHAEVWVARSEDWWFEAQDNDRIDLLPEKRRYEPGETARLQVRMPFRQATALVTVERGGVLESSVVSLSGKEPVVEVPVKAEYAPNVFISVLAVRGRVSGVQPTALIDLGKPAFKLGIAEIRVGWRAHELTVKVTPERTTYRVREKAMLKLAVRKADGQPPPTGSEVALAAVDEGLLERMPNRSWNLLEAMMRRRGYGIRTATAEMQVVGKRHYGLKALPQGGGGGQQTTRELFDTLLLWKGRVPLDARGEASVEIPLNDSLTSFRIVAVATGGISLFGTGSATIRSSQDLMVLAGIPPLVRDGDRFQSEFTIRNTTDRRMDVTVTGRVDGLAEPLAPRSITLAPGEGKTMGWEIGVPVGVETLKYEVQAGEPGGATDRVRIAQHVLQAVPVRTFQATLFRWEQPTRQPVERPSDALPSRGGLHVTLASKLTDGLPGMREWMRDYPYTCLEQEVSRVVTLRDEGGWRRLAATLPSYLDSDGLLKYFPRMTQGSEVLTAYVMSVIHESGWVIPSDVRAKMEKGLRQFISGAILRRSELPTADLSIRKLAALEALSRHGQAEPDLLGSVTIEPILWPTSALIDWWNLLQRVSGIPHREARLREAEQIVHARLNFQGTTMGFSTERSDSLWWLMVSPDVNALRLILHLLEASQWQPDLPRLMRGALARQHRGAWTLTVANAWGALAVEKFSRAFEATPVAGTTTASLAGAAQQVNWTQAPKGKRLAFPWPSNVEDLTVAHEGSGNPWVTVQAQAAIPLHGPVSSGYRIMKTLTPIEPRQPGRWSRGDLVRVRLTIEAQSDMTWVVVSDPIPAGASHLGTRLRGDSTIATQGEKREGWSWPAFEERSFEAFRAYYRYVPKGTLVVEYTIRLNQSGRFQLPTTRVEALYAPEMFGELPNAAMEVVP